MLHAREIWDNLQIENRLQQHGIKLSVALGDLHEQALCLLIKWLCHHGEWRWSQEWRLGPRFGRWAFGLKFFPVPPQKALRICAKRPPLLARTKDGTACALQYLERHGAVLKNFAWITILPMTPQDPPVGMVVDVVHLYRTFEAFLDSCVREEMYHYEDQIIHDELATVDPKRLLIMRDFPTSTGWLNRFANYVVPGLTRDVIFTPPDANYYDLSRESYEAPLDLAAYQSGWQPFYLCTALRRQGPSLMGFSKCGKPAVPGLNIRRSEPRCQSCYDIQAQTSTGQATGAPIDHDELAKVMRVAAQAQAVAEEVYAHPECIFNYCPHPEICRALPKKCQQL